ncbi:MAG: thermosome subunit beta [archaeon]
MVAQTGGQPVYVLPEGGQRILGRDAQRMNILAGKIVAETVRSTLGPKGMDKMLVDSLGDVVITNDGVTILQEMDIAHPAAKMLVEVAKAQDEEVGDGTTTAVIFAGELLKKAEELLEQNIHPSVITKGYRVANDEAQRLLQGIAQKINPSDKGILEKIAMTAMTGKNAERAKDSLAKLAVSAVLQVAETSDGKIEVDVDNIKLEKKGGGSIDDSELIQGIVIDKERVHPAMLKKVENAKVALIDTAIEIKETETDAEIRITDPEQLKAFLAEEENMLKRMVDKVKASGANVVFCQKGIDDMAQHFLYKAGIFAARRVKKSDMEKLARATTAKVVSNLDDLEAKDLGYAGLIQEKKIGGDAMIFVEKCKDPKAVTLFIRGGTEHVVDEVERAMEDAVGGVASAIELGLVVAGGGAVEIEVAKKLKQFSEKSKGREQLAIMAFAEALEVVPRTLAENAGLDPIDKLVALRSAHEKPENKWYGLDVFTGEVVDMYKAGVIEPLKIKTQAVKCASEAAEMILRIDDVISARELGKRDAGGGMPRMPGGMGDMGDM